MTAFAELGARSNFTLLDGASHPAELVASASLLGHAGIGICDTNSLAGVAFSTGRPILLSWWRAPLCSVILA